MVLGLPAHPLLVHFAVVLFPIAALGVAAIVAIPKLRARFLGAGVIALALTVPFVFAAVQSGEALEEVYYEPQPHSEYGEMMMPIAFGTLAVAVAVWLAIKYSWPKLIASSLGFLMVSASAITPAPRNRVRSFGIATIAATPRAATGNSTAAK